MCRTLLELPWFVSNTIRNMFPNARKKVHAFATLFRALRMIRMIIK